MIKNITTALKNLGSKFLIIIIALSFALWGIGDIFINNSNNPTIAKVGSSEIKLNEFQLDYQLLIDSLRQNNQQPVTEELLKALGIHHNVVENLISKKYINILSRNLSINLDDKYIKKAIINNPLFNDQLGVFNKDYFNYYLSRNNLKEKDIYKITRDAISNDILLQSIGYSEFVPEIVAKNIINKRDLARKARVFTFDTSAKLISNKKFSDSMIKQMYEKEKSNFLLPETRDISIVTFFYDDQKKNIVISEQELENFYNNNINIFMQNETRKVFLVQFDTLNEIEEFINFFNQDGDFFETLTKFNIDKVNSNLGNITINDLDPESGKAVFKLSENQITKIFKTSFGYKVFYLEKISPKQIKPYSEVKKQIKEDILKEKTNEKIYNQANIFYEKFIETKNFSLSLDTLETKIKEVKGIGLQNTNKIESLGLSGLDENEILKSIFNIKKNDISEIFEDENNNLHYIYLKTITPTKEKKLSEIKNEILNLLYDEERNILAKKLADEFKSNFNPELQYIDIKSSYTKEEVTDWITWDNRLGKEIDKNIKDLIFNSKLNKISEIINLKKGVFAIVYPTAQSNSILKDENKSKIESVLTDLNNSIESDINSAILQDLSAMYKSNVNQQFLNSF